MVFKKTPSKYGGKPRSFGRDDRGPRKFGRDDRAGGSRGGGSRGGGSFEKKRLELFDVTCDKCGKETQVPFKPTGEKPVYCRDCFNKDDSGPRRSHSSAAPSVDLREINEKLDRILDLLERD